jgi:hypothetical protein
MQRMPTPMCDLFIASLYESYSRVMIEVLSVAAEFSCQIETI